MLRGFNKKNTRILGTIRDVYIRAKENEAPALAAQLTYYSILAFFPFLIFLVTLINYTPIASERALNDLSKLLPTLVYELGLDAVNEATFTHHGTFLSFGMLAALWVSSNGMNAVIRGLNKAYNKKETRPYWKIKTLSLISIVALALAIILSLALLVFGEKIGNQLFYFSGEFYGFLKTAWTVLRLSVSFLFMMALFSMLYMLAPNRSMTLREVLPGSAFSTVGWILVSSLFSFYVNKFADYSRMYGSIGGVIALLVWLYWISIIIILGGELNASLS